MGVVGVTLKGRANSYIGNANFIGTGLLPGSPHTANSCKMCSFFQPSDGRGDAGGGEHHGGDKDDDWGCQHLPN